jgi:hypothetical protein
MRTSWLYCLVLLLHAFPAEAGFDDPNGPPTVSLAKNVVKEPAVDLLGPNGQPIGPGEAATLASQGQDLSLFNPEGNRLWQNAEYPALDAGDPDFPANGGMVRYVGQEATNIHTYMARVRSLKNPQKYFRLTLSRYAHNTMMRAALLRKLGFFVPSPRFYKNITIQFKSAAELESFITKAEEATTADFEARKWVTNIDKTRFSATFASAVLEVANPNYFDIQWGFMPNPMIPSQRAIVQQFIKYRAFRSLIVPLSLVDVPESVNRFSAKVGSFTAESVVFTHTAARTFSDSTYEDAKWLVRRIAKLKEKDWQEVVAAAGFPKEVDRLVYAKLLHRANNLYELFELPAPAIRLPDLMFSSSDGTIKEGKVTKEVFEGYPLRFAHGDRESPFNDADIARYLWIDGVSTGISEFMKRVNEHLQVRGMEWYVNEHNADIQKKILDHIKTNPFKPLYKETSTFGGPIGGVNISASRHVSTGTYYDSTAPVQLVDNVSISASLGIFRAVDGLNYTPIAGANLSYVRDYVHVRPVSSLKEATNESWAKLLVGPLMTKLGKMMDRSLDEKNEKGELKQHPVDEFLQEIKVGEVFTVSDSVATNAYLQISSPLHTIFGFAPMNVLNSFSFGADAGRVVLRQVSFVRSEEGFHVYVRSLNTNSASLQFDVNYYLNLLSYRTTLMGTDIKTNAYVINYNTDLGSISEDTNDGGKKLKEEKEKIRSALRTLFVKNDPELFEENFKHRRFDIEHKLNTKMYRAKILTERLSGFSERHKIRLVYPRNEKYPDLNPEDEAVELYSYKKGELVGRDFFGFFFDLIEGLLEKVGLFARNQDPNPANVPFGRAYWRIVDTESDLTKNGKQYPSVNLTQHTWGGWHLSRSRFMEIIDEVNERFRDGTNPRMRLIEKEAFANSDSLDFYRITAAVSIHQNGLERIRDLLLVPDQAHLDKEKKRSGNPFAWLSEVLGGNDYRATDKIFFDRFLDALGGDKNPSEGRYKYMADCEMERRGGSNSEGGGNTYNGEYHNGTYYDCLNGWMRDLLTLRREWPENDKEKQTDWYTDVIYTLEKSVPLPMLMNVAGKNNYLFKVQINGFRKGDEDGDLAFFSNSSGDPSKDFEVLNGLFALYARKTGLQPSEMERTNGAFR